MTPSANDLLSYASTALAAYAQWTPAISDDNYKGRLRTEGMAIEQANTFLSEFRVLAYVNDAAGSASAGTEGFGQGSRVPTSVSATVFERTSTGERILAIRGTVPSEPGDLWTDLRDIFLYRSVDQQSQYSVLRWKVAEWIGNGTLSPSFTVTGHSLGGFLALELAVDLPSKVDHAYLFNAPGVGGFQVSGRTMTFNEWLATVYPTRPTIDDGKVTNVTAQGGSSLISTLGIPVGDRINIAIETERLHSFNPLELINSHKIDTLTDALGVYDLLAAVDPSVSIADSTKIVEAASSDNRASLERVVKTLALVFGTTVPATVESRDLLFSRIDEIKKAMSKAGSASDHDIVLLSDKTVPQIVGLAHDDIAVRYALKQLDSFALSGDDELFSPFNADGELDLVRGDGSGGALSDKWIADRAELLLAQAFVNTFEDGNTIVRNAGPGKDLVMIQPDLDPLTIRIVGVEGPRPPIKTPQIIFGSDQNDTLRGLDADDHLYGESGNDTLTGGKGNDYLEGGAGDETLDGGVGNNRLEGGTGVDTYIVYRGVGIQDITDSDGLGQIRLDGAALNGGHFVRPNRYEGDDGHIYTFNGSLSESGTLIVDDEIQIANFHNGDLGIALEDADTPAEPPEVGGSHLYMDNIFDAENRIKLPEDQRFPYGSPDDDTYIAGPSFPPYFLGFAGDDHIVGYGPASATLLGGAGDDVIENRDVVIDADVPSNFPIVLAGEGGRDWLTGSANDEMLAGDFYKIVFSPPGRPNTIYIDAVEIILQVGTITDLWYAYPGDLVGLASKADLRDEYAGGMAQALSTFVGYSLVDRPDDAFDDVIDAGAGDDFVVGGPGNDVILGGEGNDQLYGDLSHWVRFNWGGMDIDDDRFLPYLAYLGLPGDDYIDGGDGDDLIQDIGGFTATAIGGDGDDRIYVILDNDLESDRERIAFLDGGDGDDNLNAVALLGAIMADGGPGNDLIWAIGDLAYLDGGDGDDTYHVYGLDITIRDAGGADTLILEAGRDEFGFSRAGDGLEIVFWYDLGDDDRVGPDGEEWAQSTLVIEDWFVGPGHRIEQIVLVPADGEETEWTPDDITAALDAEDVAWSDFVEPELQAFVPFELALPAEQPPASTSDPPSLPSESEPDPPSEPPPVIPPITPQPPPLADDDTTSDYSPSQAIPIPIHIEITDREYAGPLAGSDYADVFSVLSDHGVVIDAGAGDDSITTGSGDDEIRPGPGNDIVNAGGGNDRIIVDRFDGNKWVDAGSGIDVLSIGRSISSVNARVENGRIVIQDAEGKSLSVANVNIYELTDALYVQAGTMPEATVAWMYWTWVGHTPDARGMQFWLDQVTHGNPLADLEHVFVGAIEKTSFFTEASDDAFLDGLRARAFDPGADPPERSYLLQQLQAGAITRDQIINGLVAFEEEQVTITGIVLVPETV